MVTEIVIVLAWAGSIVFTALIGLGIVTYVRRTWQLIRAEGEGSSQVELLDALDQLQTQLYAMSERLERMERRLEVGNAPPVESIPPPEDP